MDKASSYIPEQQFKKVTPQRLVKKLSKNIALVSLIILLIFIIIIIGIYKFSSYKNDLSPAVNIRLITPAPTSSATSVLETYAKANTGISTTVGFSLDVSQISHQLFSSDIKWGAPLIGSDSSFFVIPSSGRIHIATQSGYWMTGNFTGKPEDFFKALDLDFVYKMGYQNYSNMAAGGVEGDGQGFLIYRGERARYLLIETRYNSGLLPDMTLKSPGRSKCPCNFFKVFLSDPFVPNYIPALYPDYKWQDTRARFFSFKRSGDSEIHQVPVFKIWSQPVASVPKDFMSYYKSQLEQRGWSVNKENTLDLDALHHEVALFYTQGYYQSMIFLVGYIQLEDGTYQAYIEHT